MSESLPRSLDVVISLSKASTEIATDMTLMCILTPKATFQEADRVKYYTTFAAFALDYPSNTSIYYAGKAFFERTPHPEKLAVGLIASADIAGVVTSGAITIGDLTSITDGSLKIYLGDAETVITLSDLDFHLCEDLADVAAVIAAAATFPAGATCVASATGVVISTGTNVGDDAIVSYAWFASGQTGTDVSALLGLTALAGATLSQGHTAVELADEAEIVRQASVDAGYPIYGWALDKVWRDTADQKSFADYVNALESSFCILTTNLATAYSSVDTANIGYYCHNLNLDAVGVFYHDNAQYYPDVSYIALMLAVDYAATNSAITAKFKSMTGISPVAITSTQLLILAGRRINTYTLIGNNSETIRDGVQSSDDYFSDDTVNLDNFVEELQVEVFNVFLRNKKVPYTPAGQLLIVSACQLICQRYVTNGVFADRPVTDTTNESGVSVLPAFEIVPMGIETATSSDRASRIAPPVQITAYLAGAIHKVTVNVDVIP